MSKSQWMPTTALSGMGPQLLAPINFTGSRIRPAPCEAKKAATYSGGVHHAVARQQAALFSAALWLINMSAKVDLILRSLMDPNKDQ